MQDWAGTCNHLSEICEVFPKISEGSEHLVYLHPENARVFKATKLGLFGESYYLDQGRMSQRNCSPLDYLIRMRIWDRVFGSAPEPIGITAENQIVSFHDFISGVPPSQNEVNEFLASSGFAPVRIQYWLWEREYPHEGFKIGLGDARDENFVKSPLGIVPIDVRLWFSSFE